MKILVLGCNGMAGHLISLYFRERGYDVIGFARTKSPLLENTIVGDACNLNLIKDTVISENFDVVINCIGILNKSADENKSSAILLNSYLPHYLEGITKEMRTRIFHMSTDCVFAGNDGPYFEDSQPDGQTYYDRTKALGEVINNKDLTFRNSIIGPDIKKNGIGLFNWFMQQENQINGFTEAIWTGVTTLTLAKAMEQAIKENLSGLYNLVNNKSISKYNLCSLFNKYFRGNELEIVPCNTLRLDKSLRTHRKDFSFVVPSYEQQIKDLREWVDEHTTLYPHYRLK